MGPMIRRTSMRDENMSTVDLATYTSNPTTYDGHDSSIESQSRSNTMTSTMSFYAPPPFENSAVYAARLVPQRGIPISALERPGTGTRAFFAKSGRALIKHASKLSLSSSYLADGEASREARHRASNSHDISKHLPRPDGPVDKRDAKKRNISEPFGFRHVTHTDRAYLDSLNRVPKSELVSEFTALRAGQRPRTELRGIRVDDLPPTKPLPDTFQDLSPTEDQQVVPDTLPTSPPPATPLKDHIAPASEYRHVRQSRSIENFSRPVSSSASASRLLPARLSSRNAFVPPQLSPTREDVADYEDGPGAAVDESGMVDELRRKPLPNLPPVVHAVSTDDDSARELHTAPLPQFSRGLDDVVEEDINHGLPRAHVRLQDAPWPRTSLRHVQSFPCSPRGHQHGPRAIVEEATDAKVVTNGPFTASTTSTTRHLDPMVASKSTGTSSVANLKASSVIDWEDAIDYSWDLAVESDGQSIGDMAATAPHAEHSSPPLATLTGLPPYHMPTGTIGRSASKMQDPNTRAVKSLQPSPLFSSSSRTRRTEVEVSRMASPPLLGLGIDTVMPLPPDSHANCRDYPAGDGEHNLTASFTSDQTAPSVVTKSSSQESIIFSIASSIMGTHRSSNSSTSLADVTTANTSVDHSPKTVACEDWREREPLETLQEDSPSGKVSRDPSPSHLSSTPLKTTSSHKRAQSLAHNFVVRDQSPSTPLPPRSPKPLGRSSTSRIPIPARSSSIAIGAARPSTSGGRQRAATTSSKYRHASRASYSLFPGTTPPTPTRR